MVCKNCQTEVQNGEKFCPTCGAFLEQQNQEGYVPQGQNVPPQNQPGYVNPEESAFVYGMFKQECSSKLFLALCVLASVNPVLTILSAGLSGIVNAVIPALFAISAWMMYLAATQNNDATGFVNPLKIISVVTTVQWVLNWVLVGLFALVGVLFLAGSDSLNGYMDEFLYSYGFGLSDLFSDMIAVAGVIFFILAGVYAVLNVFYFGNLRKCTASFRDSAIFGRFMVQKVGAIKTWFMVVGVLSAISVVSNLTQFGGFVSLLGIVGGACGAATYIVASKVLENVKKATNCD